MPLQDKTLSPHLPLCSLARKSPDLSGPDVPKILLRLALRADVLNLTGHFIDPRYGLWRQATPTKDALVHKALPAKRLWPHAVDGETSGSSSTHSSHDERHAGVAGILLRGVLHGGPNDTGNLHERISAALDLGAGRGGLNGALNGINGGIPSYSAHVTSSASSSTTLRSISGGGSGSGSHASPSPPAPAPPPPYAVLLSPSPAPPQNLSTGSTGTGTGTGGTGGSTGTGTGTGSNISASTDHGLGGKADRDARGNEGHARQGYGMHSNLMASVHGLIVAPHHWGHEHAKALVTAGVGLAIVGALALGVWLVCSASSGRELCFPNRRAKPGFRPLRSVEGELYSPCSGFASPSFASPSFASPTSASPTFAPRISTSDYIRSPSASLGAFTCDSTLTSRSMSV